MANTVYNRIKQGLAQAGVSWKASGGSTIKALLLKTTYSPNADHDFVSDVVSNELSGGTYVRKTLTLIDATLNDTNDRSELDANDVVWSALTTSPANQLIRWAVLYKEVTTDSDSPVLLCVDLDPTVQAGFAANGGDLTIQWQASPAAVLTVT